MKYMVERQLPQWSLYWQAFALHNDQHNAEVHMGRLVELGDSGYRYRIVEQDF